jgi:hypothetical protein
MRIISTKSIGVHSLKMVVFGCSGSGKTTFCSTTGEPTLIISAESGLLSLASKDCDVIEINVDDNGNVIPKENRIERLTEVYKYLLTEECQSKYKWICIDSLTEIGQNLVEKLKKQFPDKKDSINMWGEYSTAMRSLIKAFRDLNNYNVIFTALSIDEKDDNGRRQIAIDLNGKISQQLPQYFDEVFYLHVRNEGDKTVRKLLCKPNETVPYAKDRSCKLSMLEDPSLETITTKIRSV